MLRLPDGMRDQLKWAAAANGRTLNAELVNRLQTSLSSTEKPPLPRNVIEELEYFAKLNDRSFEMELFVCVNEGLKREHYVEDHGGAEAVAKFEKLIAAADELKVRQQRETLIYVVIDAAGYPISWEEMRTIWHALIQDEGIKVAEMHVNVLTPDMESSSARAEQAVSLAKRLRVRGQSTVLKQSKREPELKP